MQPWVWTKLATFSLIVEYKHIHQTSEKSSLVSVKSIFFYCNFVLIQEKEKPSADSGLVQKVFTGLIPAWKRSSAFGRGSSLRRKGEGIGFGGNGKRG